MVKIVDFEADDGNQVGFGEEPLRVDKAGEGIARIVLIEAGLEDACNLEALVTGNETERGEFSLRAGYEDGVAGMDAEGVGEIAADDDGL